MKKSQGTALFEYVLTTALFGIIVGASLVNLSQNENVINFFMASTGLQVDLENQQAIVAVKGNDINTNVNADGSSGLRIIGDNGFKFDTFENLMPFDTFEDPSRYRTLVAHECIWLGPEHEWAMNNTYVECNNNVCNLYDGFGNVILENINKDHYKPIEDDYLSRIGSNSFYDISENLPEVQSNHSNDSNTTEAQKVNDLSTLNISEANTEELYGVCYQSHCDTYNGDGELVIYWQNRLWQ